MRSATPDTSLLSRLLRGRLRSGKHPLTGKQNKTEEPQPLVNEHRSSAVIGALMRDTREAYLNQTVHPATTASDPGTIQSEAETLEQLSQCAIDPGDLSAFVLETLNELEWEDWISARCDFPETGPFIISGSSHELDLIAELMQQVFDDAGDDGEDLTVHIYTGIEGGSARITVTGPFSLSIPTLTMIKKYRRQMEAIGGALYTVRTLSTAGFEALIPER